MPKARPQKIEAWSFSRWVDYDKCPFLAKCKYIDKLPLPPNDAMNRGKNIHKEAEDFTKGKLPALPISLDRFDAEFEEAKQFKQDWPEFSGVEEQWAFTKDWEPTKYFGEDTWVRIKMDLWQMPEDGVLAITDHKTGQIRPGYEPQLEIYGVAGFSQFEGIHTVTTDLWYIDQGVIIGANGEDPDPAATFTIDQYEGLKKKWNQRTRRMLNDTRFDPNPNRFCEWCDFSKAKGGPCKY